MNIERIETEVGLGAALARLNELFNLDPEPGTPEGEELDKLATLIEKYEEIHYPMGE